MRTLLIVLFIGFYGFISAQSDTGSVWEKNGTSADAIWHTQKNAVVGISIHFGHEVDHAKRDRVINYIDKKIFTGENEAPIAFFISKDFKGDGIGCSVFVKGRRQINPLNNQEIFNLSELADRASKIVGVYKLVYGLSLNGRE